MSTQDCTIFIHSVAHIPDERRQKRIQRKTRKKKTNLEYSRIFKGYTLADISGISDDTEFSDMKQFCTRTFHQTAVGCSYHKSVFYSFHVIPW